MGTTTTPTTTTPTRTLFQALQLVVVVVVVSAAVYGAQIFLVFVPFEAAATVKAAAAPAGGSHPSTQSVSLYSSG